jgi:GDP-D-mannose dehydratase
MKIVFIYGVTGIIDLICQSFFWKKGCKVVGVKRKPSSRLIETTRILVHNAKHYQAFTSELFV